MTTFETPTRRAIAYAVSLVLVLGLFGLWLYQSIHGQSPTPVVRALVTVLVLAGASILFGDKVVSKAVALAGDVRAMLLGQSTDQDCNDDETETDPDQ